MKLNFNFISTLNGDIPELTRHAILTLITKYSLIYKRGCVFSMVIWPAFRMRQYRANDHAYHAPQFTFINQMLLVHFDLHALHIKRQWESSYNIIYRVWRSSHVSYKLTLLQSIQIWLYLNEVFPNDHNSKSWIFMSINTCLPGVTEVYCP